MPVNQLNNNQNIRLPPEVGHEGRRGEDVAPPPWIGHLGIEGIGHGEHEDHDDDDEVDGGEDLLQTSMLSNV